MKSGKIICLILLHFAVGIFILLGIAGQIKDMKWAPINSDGQIIQSIDPLIPGAFIGWGVVVILLFWLYVGFQGRANENSDQK